jgi:hypothetical protein
MFYSVRKYVGYFIVLTIKKFIIRVHVPRTFRMKRLLVKYVLSVKSLVSEPSLPGDFIFWYAFVVSPI